MAKSLEEILSALVAKAIADEMRKSEKALESFIEVKLQEGFLALSEMHSHKEEKLITLTEAVKRLGVSREKVKQLIADGRIMAGSPPGGYLKVSEASLNAYIAGLVKGAV